MTYSSFKKQVSLAYSSNTETLAQALQYLPWFVWLDSNAPHTHGRFDILTALPIASVSAWQKTCYVEIGQTRKMSQESPFCLIKQLLAQYPSLSKQENLPFTGGALGYISYDAGFPLLQLSSFYAQDLDLPLIAMGIYDWAIVVDHDLQQTQLVFHGLDEAAAARFEQIMAALKNTAVPQVKPFNLTSDIEANLSWPEYQHAFNQIQEHIRAGDCYQINFAQRFRAGYQGDLFRCYQQLRAISPAPYAGYFSFPQGTILSVSPERFIQVADGEVITQPIKGTRPRHADPAQDSAYATELINSPKDRAENVMIVDLLRNDLGKVCQPGSVTVTELFGLKSYSNVHHLVSTIKGTLTEDHNALDLFIAAFPGGSITGAPKRRAMEIIAQLEPHARSVYCGSLVYFGFDGNMDSNITIRTVVANKAELFVWAGGGIVADSTAEAEYQETFTKVRNILRGLRGDIPIVNEDATFRSLILYTHRE